MLMDGSISTVRRNLEVLMWIPISTRRILWKSILVTWIISITYLMKFQYEHTCQKQDERLKDSDIIHWQKWWRHYKLTARNGGKKTDQIHMLPKWQEPWIYKYRSHFFMAINILMVPFPCYPRAVDLQICPFIVSRVQKLYNSIFT